MTDLKASKSFSSFLSLNNIYATGLALRAICFIYGGVSLVDRVELSSPLVSYKLLQDGIAMIKQGISPYSGDSVHVQPILLNFFGIFSDLPRSYSFLFFVLCDIIATYLLYRASEKLETDTYKYVSNTVAACYFLNPVTVASCSACSLSAFYNVLLASFTLFFTQGNAVKSSLVLGLLSQFTLYHLILIGSLFLRFKDFGQRVYILGSFFASFIIMLLINFAANNFRWDFIEDTYCFMYYVDDLTPNVGVFWYFFTQVFEHFRFFYISVFQINLLVYLVPLYLTVRNDTNLHFIISMLLITVFSPYPCLNDAAVYMAFLPTIDKYWKQPMRFILPITCAIVTCVVLMPIMWHMWIIAGSGNANFYFAVTLIYNLAQVYLLGDLLYAYFRKEAIDIAGDFINDKTNFMFY